MRPQATVWQASCLHEKEMESGITPVVPIRTSDITENPPQRRMNSLASLFFARPQSVLFLSILIPFALLTSACGTVESVLPQKGERVEALELDPTEEHALVEVPGARWVLFNLDLGRGAGRVIRSAFDGAASVGQRMIEVRPEEKIMEVFQSAREAARIEQARSGWNPPVPSLPLSVVP